MSIHFPRRLNTTINCSTDDRTYDLPSNFINVISVEYPTGEDPPAYLVQKNYTAWGSSDLEGFYDIFHRMDQSDAPELWISAKPTTGESIEVHYLGEHDYLDDDSDTVTVLDRHLELIVLFVRWAAYQELASSESADPDPTSLGMGTLELNAYRARRDYRLLLSKMQTAESQSKSSTWKMDKSDRVY
jgi:hypothetical protein